MQKFNRKKNDAKIVKAPKPKIYGDARDAADYGRARCTMPPRTRPGKEYPGGRRMRRALARLASNQKGTAEARAHAGKASGKSKPASAFKQPGAMNP